MSSLLARGAGPDPRQLQQRVAWWRAREAALATAAPDLLCAEGPRPREASARLETFLPVWVFRVDLFEPLQAWFGAALTALGVDLDASLLASARSVFDVRAWLPGAEGLLPSDLLAQTATAEGAERLAFALFSSRRCGAALGRYPEHLKRVVAAAPEGARLRLWDAGCGTGEGTWEAAFALAERAEAVAALGTTPWPLERLMASEGARPCDPAGAAALNAFVAAGPREQVDVRFAAHDLRRDPPPGAFEVVLCHGVLGESLPGDAAIAAALHTLAAAVAPGGVRSITDRFRADVSARVRATATEALSGWAPLGPGLFGAPRGS